jgi:RNA polymerase sigma-70 factor, ECF subfamily
MSGGPPRGPELLDRLLAGDRLAFLEFSRMVSGFLAQLRAYDFRDEWDDLRQEVLASVVANAQAGRLREPEALAGYVRIVTRNKFIDRLKKHIRHHEKDALPWDDETARAASAPAPDAAAEGAELWTAVAALPEEERAVVEGVYRHGRTYEEASAVLGVPLGTLKRRLTQALSALRTRLAAEADDG